jgi:hypothetical protein
MNTQLLSVREQIQQDIPELQDKEKFNIDEYLKGINRDWINTDYNY